MKLEINDFNGPLDLLLHLVKESKMDIYEVSISMIIEQYIEFIHSLTKQNLDIASEYLVMNAELIHLKSKMLLNIKDEEESTNEEITSEEELRRRLIEYQKYKELTTNFKDLENKRSEILTKLPTSLLEYKEDVELNTDTSLDDLIGAFNEFLKRRKFSKPLSTKITKKELSVEKRVIDIRNKLKFKNKMAFNELFDEINKPYVVVTFLSILEMTKNKEIKITQNKNFDNILIETM